MNRTQFLKRIAGALGSAEIRGKVAADHQSADLSKWVASQKQNTDGSFSIVRPKPYNDKAMTMDDDRYRGAIDLCAEKQRQRNHQVSVIMGKLKSITPHNP